jgi:hypothetical protein
MTVATVPDKADLIALLRDSSARPSTFRVPRLTHDDAEQTWSAAAETLSQEDQVVEGILLKAHYHDAVCQEIYRSIYWDLGDHRGLSDLIDRIGYLNFAIVGLCTQIGESARGRARELSWLGQAAKDAIGDLDNRGVEGLLRPIFDQSGIGYRFEAQSVFEKYPELVEHGNTRRPRKQ